MGDAAEYEIWRRYGVDTSADGHLDRFYSKRFYGKSRRSGKTAEVKSAAQVTAHKHGYRPKIADYGFDTTGYFDCPAGNHHTPTSRAKLFADKYLADTRHFISRDEATALAAKLNPTGFGSSDTINCRCVYTPVTSKPTENEMNNQEAITLMQLQLGATVFKAEYLNGGNNGKRYSFKDVIGLGLEKGDHVVVETRGEYAVVKVVETEVLPTEISCSFAALVHAVSKLDLTALNHVKEAEKAANYRLSMSEVTSKLDNYRKQLGEDQFIAVTNMLAGTRQDGVVERSLTEEEAAATVERNTSEEEFMKAEAKRMSTPKGGA